MLDTLAEREKLTSLAYAGGWVALLMAIALVLWNTSRLFWQIFPSEPSSTTSAYNTPGPAASNPTDRVNLADLHLFGQAGAIAAPAIIEAPETTLDLRLMGTLTSADPESGLAIIIDGENRESYYGVGDDLPGSARLHEIHADRVILVRQGRYETLSLREENAQAANQPRRGVSGAREVAAAQSGSNLSALRGAQVDLRSLQQQYRLDPAQLAQNIRFSTFTENGKPIGVRMQAGRDAALMRLMNQAGLRSTDIITSVNGIPMDDPSRSIEALAQLQNQTRFTVVVRRDGQQQTLDIDLNR